MQTSASLSIRPARSAVRSARAVTWTVLGLIALILLYQFGMNMHHSTGLPYWDDWGYFFGERMGIQTPLTLSTAFAKDSDHIAPMFKVLTHALWRAVGVDFLFFRFVGWLSFAAMLVLYALLLARYCVLSPWGGVLVAASGLFLVSTANAEYFYYQYMGLAQPIFFVFVFGFLLALAERRHGLAFLLLLFYGSTGVFGAAYVLGPAGAAAVLALGGARSPRGFLTDRRVLVTVVGGLVLTLAVFFITFYGSYANHTQQPLTWPWQRDFWIFLFGACAAAFSLTVDTLPERWLAAVGAGVFLGYALPIPLLLLGRRKEGDDGIAALILSSLIAGALLVTMATAAGRTHLCGDAVRSILGCGGIPRYAYPMLLGLPAVVAAWMRVPLPRPARFAVAGGLLLAIAVPSVTGRDGRLTLAHWDFSRLDAMMAQRDETATACLAAYLRDGAEVADWSRPVVCPTTSPRNLSQFLRAAHGTGAAFLRPIFDRAGEPSGGVALGSVLRSGTLSGDGSALSADLSVSIPVAAGPDAGWLDRTIRLPDGTVTVAGWAIDRERRKPAALVAVVAGDRIVAVGRPGDARPDVAAALGEPAFASSGFQLPLPSGLERVRVFAIGADNEAVELNPKGGVAVVQEPPS